MSNTKNWGKPIGGSKKPEQPEEKVKSLREDLESMDMKELRNYVKMNKLKARDTSKEELIEEILKEVE